MRLSLVCHHVFNINTLESRDLLDVLQHHGTARRRRHHACIRVVLHAEVNAEPQVRHTPTGIRVEVRMRVSLHLFQPAWLNRGWLLHMSIGAELYRAQYSASSPLGSHPGFLRERSRAPTSPFPHARECWAEAWRRFGQLAARSKIAAVAPTWAHVPPPFPPGRALWELSPQDDIN